MKTKTEAAGLIRRMARDARLNAGDFRVARDFGVAQRLEHIADDLERAADLLLADGKEYVMPESLTDFMGTAPVGSKIIFKDGPFNADYYIKIEPDEVGAEWQRMYGDSKGSTYMVESFSDDEDRFFTREVGRG